MVRAAAAGTSGGAGTCHRRRLARTLYAVAPHTHVSFSPSRIMGRVVPDHHHPPPGEIRNGPRG